MKYYVEGFMTKCAEAGLTQAEAVQLLEKEAARMDPVQAYAQADALQMSDAELLAMTERSALEHAIRQGIGGGIGSGLFTGLLAGASAGGLNMAGGNYDVGASALTGGALGLGLGGLVGGIGGYLAHPKLYQASLEEAASRGILRR